MKITKLFLAAMAAVAATVILGALTASAPARSLSNSTNGIAGTWTRMNFSGGFGTVECEVTVSGTISTTIAKIANAAAGSITAANMPRCIRGGATVLRETLPWTLTYNSFTGTLPEISTTTMNVVEASFRLREPTFGATCLMRSRTGNIFKRIWNFLRRVARIILTVSTMECTGAINVNATVEGASSAISALTVTLI